LPEEAAISLFLENFTVIDPVNPVPVIVKVVTPPLSERLRVESPVIEGGWTVDVSSEVTPLRPIVDPLPT
jgi:hypothetical protein